MTPKVWGIVSVLASSAWAASPAAGDWIGTLKAGPAELRVVLHVKEAEGKLSATLDSLDQGAKAIPIDSITFGDNKLAFSSAAISGQYEGSYDAAKQTFAGTWTQNGNSLPLSFEHYVEKPKPAHTGPAAKPSDIDGTWEGKIDVGGQTLRVVFHIKTDEDGNLTATTDSPDQNGYGIPVTTVKRDGKSLKMEIKGIGAEYEGTINDAKNKIDGTLRQGGGELPLVLERK
jgi:hypothetical protein